MESVKDWADSLYLQYSPKMAAVAAALVSMMTAQALGVDIFGFFGRWTNEVFTFVNLPDKADYEFHQKSMADYDSLLAPYRLRRRFANYPD